MTVSFPKSEQWDESRRLVLFPADVNNRRITCAVSGEALVDHFGAKNTKDMNAFHTRRDDIEKVVVRLINKDRFQEDGTILIDSDTRNEAIEFARFTRRNFEFVVEAAEHDPDLNLHVVTQLTNSLLGLVVFPKERSLLARTQTKTLDDLSKEGWPCWTVTLDDVREPTLTLANIVYHLRNAVAHGRLTFTSDSHQLDEVALIVEDRKPKASQPYWRAQIGARDLRDFCLCFLNFIEDAVG